MKGVLAETFTNIIESKFVILHILQEFLSSVKLGKAFCLSVSTQFRASPFERALFSALNRVLLIN